MYFEMARTSTGFSNRWGVELLHVEVLEPQPFDKLSKRLGHAPRRAVGANGLRREMLKMPKVVGISGPTRAGKTTLSYGITRDLEATRRLQSVCFLFCAGAD